MDSDIGRDIKPVGISLLRFVLLGKVCDKTGQSTVEYAIVMAAFLSIVVAIGLLMNALGDGMFVDHAISAASHNVEVIFGGAADVFSY